MCSINSATSGYETKIEIHSRRWVFDTESHSCHLALHFGEEYIYTTSINRHPTHFLLCNHYTYLQRKWEQPDRLNQMFRRKQDPGERSENH